MEWNTFTRTSWLRALPRCKLADISPVYWTLYSTVQCSTVQYSAMQYSTVQYSAVHIYLIYVHVMDTVLSVGFHVAPSRWGWVQNVFSRPSTTFNSTSHLPSDSSRAGASSQPTPAEVKVVKGLHIAPRLFTCACDGLLIALRTEDSTKFMRASYPRNCEF